MHALARIIREQRGFLSVIFNHSSNFPSPNHFESFVTAVLHTWGGSVCQIAGGVQGSAKFEVAYYATDTYVWAADASPTTSTPAFLDN